MSTSLYSGSGSKTLQARYGSRFDRHEAADKITVGVVKPECKAGVIHNCLKTKKKIPDQNFCNYQIPLPLPSQKWG